MSTMSGVATALACVANVQVSDVIDVPPTVYFTDLSDDSLTQILKCCRDVSTIASLARCCKNFAHLASVDALWMHAVMTRWPFLPERFWCTPIVWRTLHRERSQLPSWRYFVVRMDEVEHLLGKIKVNVDGDGEGRGEASGVVNEPVSRIDDCDRLAALLVAIFCSGELCGGGSILGHTPGRDWARRVGECLCEAPVRESLREWTSAVMETLDDFYERPFSRPEHRARLVRGMTCASALRLLTDEIYLYIPGVASQSTIPRLYAEHVARFRMDVGADRVETTLQSLEMEGFDVSVPPACHPAGMHAYRQHMWWHAHAPISYCGGVERC